MKEEGLEVDQEGGKEKEMEEETETIIMIKKEDTNLVDIEMIPERNGEEITDTTYI